MGIFDWFIPKGKRELELEGRRRRGIRNAKAAAEKIDQHIVRLEGERDKDWERALASAKAGRTSEMRRAIKTYRGNEILISRLSTQRWAFHNVLNRMEMAKTNQDVASALNEIEKVLRAKPENINSVLGKVQKRLAKEEENDAAWEKYMAREMAEDSTGFKDIPNETELESAILRAVEVGHNCPAEIDSKKDELSDEELAARIQAGQERLQSLLEEEK